MNTCKTCKWWSSEQSEWTNPQIDFRKCLHTKMALGSDAHEGAPDGIRDVGMDAGYQDFESGPDFGCIHHEEKS